MSPLDRLKESPFERAMREARQDVYDNIEQTATYGKNRCVVTPHMPLFREDWFLDGGHQGRWDEDWQRYWKTSGTQDRRNFPDLLDRGQGFLGCGFLLERATGLEGYPRYWTLENHLFSESNPGYRVWRALPENTFERGRYGITPDAVEDTLTLMSEIVKADGAGAFTLPMTIAHELTNRARSGRPLFDHNVSLVYGFQADALFRVSRHQEHNNRKTPRVWKVERKPRVVVILADLFGL